MSPAGAFPANRAVAGDNTILSKTIRAGMPSEARVIYDPDSGLM